MCYSRLDPRNAHLLVDLLILLSEVQAGAESLAILGVLGGLDYLGGLGAVSGSASSVEA